MLPMLPPIHRLLDTDSADQPDNNDSSSLPQSTSMPTLTQPNHEVIEPFEPYQHNISRYRQDQHHSQPLYESSRLDSQQSDYERDSISTPSARDHAFVPSVTQEKGALNYSCTNRYSKDHSNRYSPPMHMSSSPSSADVDSTKRQRQSISPRLSPTTSGYGETNAKRNPRTFESSAVSKRGSKSTTAATTTQEQATNLTHWQSQQRASSFEPSVSPSSSSASPSPSISTATAASTPMTADAIIAVTNGTASASISERARFNSSQGTSRAIRLDFKDPGMVSASASTDYSEHMELHRNDSYSSRGGSVQSATRETSRHSPTHLKNSTHEPVLSFRNPHHSPTSTYSSQSKQKRDSSEMPPQDPEIHRSQREYGEYQTSNPHTQLVRSSNEQEYQRQPQLASSAATLHTQTKYSPQTSFPHATKGSSQTHEEEKMIEIKQERPTDDSHDIIRHGEITREGQGYDSASSPPSRSSMRGVTSPVDPSLRQHFDTIPHSPHHRSHSSHATFQQQQQQQQLQEQERHPHSPPSGYSARESDHKSSYSTFPSRQHDLEQVHLSHGRRPSKDSPMSFASLGKSHSRQIQLQQAPRSNQINPSSGHRHPYHPSHPNDADMRRVRISDEDYYQARAPHPDALRNHSVARPQSPQAGHMVDPIHPHARYDSQRYYQHDRTNHTGRRDVDFEGGPSGNWDDRHAYDYRDSNKLGGSAGALQSTLAPASQWRGSRRGIRHSVSEPDIQLIELEQRRERHVFDHREDERDKGRLEDAEEGVEGGSEGEFEDGREYNRDHGRIRRPESSASQHTSPPSVPRMAYEGQRHSQQPYIGDYERGVDQGRHFQHHHPRESMTQAELHDPAFRNHRELKPREIQSSEMQQQHAYDYPPQSYHHQAPRASHLPPSNATFRPQQHPYMPSHRPFTPQQQQQQPQQQQQQQQQQQLQQQQQQHGSMASNHPSSSSTFMDNQSSASSAAAGPNRRGPYMSRQRALLAGLEPSTPSSRYQCQYCQKRFSRPSSLRIHTYSHTGERPFKCSEEGCGRQFSVQSNMRRHLRVHRLGRMRTDFPRE